jgi:hypothetical protein
LIVVADYPCSDLCPAATVRIIHYAVPADQCDRVGGALDNVHVPRGAGVRLTAFCRPPVLVTGARPAPRGVPPCKAGLSPRLAGPKDFVCAPPEARARSRAENRVAEQRRESLGSAACRPGFVWREAFPGDLACVPPHVRQIVRAENRAAASALPPGATNPAMTPAQGVIGASDPLKVP